MTLRHSTHSHPFWTRARQAVLWIATLLSCAGLLAAAHAGDVRPEEFKGAVLLVLTFPAWLLACIVVAIFNAFWCRQALIISAITIALSWSAITEYSPFNFTSPDASRYEGMPKIKLMTFNAFNFNDFQSNPYDQWATIRYIIEQDADIVNIQECPPLDVAGRYGLDEAKIDSLRAVYPYMYRYDNAQGLFSKYPAEMLYSSTEKDGGGNAIVVFRLQVEGVPLTLINVHLQSYRLSNDDKKLYREITKLDDKDNLRGTFKDVRHNLLSKVQLAAVNRAVEADTLAACVERYGNTDLIIAGDFNDVPGCYTLRRMNKLGMHNLYSELGLGPMVTYNANRFYFRIDHVLWRGNLTPLSIERGDTRVSDHYPLITTFVLGKK